MDKFYNETLAKLENEIKEFEIEADCSIERIEAVIQLIIKCLFDVKKYILKRGFKNVDEEIRFFKYQKPIIVSDILEKIDFLPFVLKSGLQDFHLYSKQHFL